MGDGGRLQLGTKCDILTCLEDLCPSQTKTTGTTCMVLDGAAIIQMMKPAVAKTFRRYSSHIFLLNCAVCQRCGPRLGYLHARQGCKETCGWECCRTRKLA